MRKNLVCLFLASTPLLADDDRFRERFADPATRTAALAELIPGNRRMAGPLPSGLRSSR